MRGKRRPYKSGARREVEGPQSFHPSAGGAICVECLPEGAGVQRMRRRECASGRAQRRHTWRARGVRGFPLGRRPDPPPSGDSTRGRGGHLLAPPAPRSRGLQRGQSYGRRLLRAACVLTKADPRRFGGVKSAAPGALSGGALPLGHGGAWQLKARLCSASRTPRD
ncbi:hypothetical protein HPB51_014305 [Rhipicephalus microplus]|uniref:Uncharacterized protein n=1 Tax=Rhipicephalus microplus TaxID=6941 RepID=A0A9J6DA42_RHIMP|nr:hypothetical protein HPB51_014305 [Rhipicephalus microplus]